MTIQEMITSLLIIYNNPQSLIWCHITTVADATLRLYKTHKSTWYKHTLLSIRKECFLGYKYSRRNTLGSSLSRVQVFDTSCTTPMTSASNMAVSLSEWKACSRWCLWDKNMFIKMEFWTELTKLTFLLHRLPVLQILCS